MIGGMRLVSVVAVLALTACTSDPLPGSDAVANARATGRVAAQASSPAPTASESSAACGGACGGACARAANAGAEASADKSSFGAAIAEGTPFVALADIVKAPAQWAGKRVRTRGAVVAVCQRAGCWADLKPEGDAKAIVPTHVTMHDHAFFLPKIVKTRNVEVEGLLATRALTKSECDHYNAEGATLTPGEPVVTIDALGVALR